MKIFISITLFLLSINSHSVCIPENEKIHNLDENFSTEELKLACSHLKNGDVIEKCNGEVCGALTYPKAINDVKLHAKPDLKSPIIGEVKKCQLLKDFKIVSIFREYGEAEALTDLNGYGLKKGQSVKYVWSGSGNYFGCIQNKPIVFYAYNKRDLSKSCFYEIKSSVLEEWVQHRASNGKLGYSKPSEKNHFYIPYGGWAESLICEEDRPLKG